MRGDKHGLAFRTLWLLAILVVGLAAILVSGSLGNRRGGCVGYVSTRLCLLRDYLANYSQTRHSHSIFEKNSQQINSGNASFVDYQSALQWKSRYGTIEERVRLMEQAVKRYPTDARCYQLLAIVYARSGNEEAARQAMERCPHRKSSYYVCSGVLMEEMQQKKEARADYRKALGLLNDEISTLQGVENSISSGTVETDHLIPDIFLSLQKLREKRAAVAAKLKSL